MRVDNQIMISPKYSKDNYLSLRLNRINEDDFKKALEIFTDRINGWFFDQIKLMLNDAEKNGFAIIALDCILIETFWHFRNGNKQNNKESIFCEFLSKTSPNVFNEEDAKDFYKCIRCALLHSGQTDKEFVLSTKGRCVDRKNGIVFINVIEISQLLFEYFEKYIVELNNQENTILRRNFINRMDETIETIKYC